MSPSHPVEVLGTPTFAVVIPAFNRAARLSRSAESAVNQVGHVPEIVVVDDGSVDDMSVVFTHLADRHVCIVRSDRNQGPAAARNIGTSHSSAEWLTFLDSDDTLLPDALETFAQASDERCGLVRARSVDTSRITGAPSDQFLAGTFAVRRAVFEDAGGYDVELRFSENSELLMRLLPALDRARLEQRTVAAPTVALESVGTSRNYDQDRIRAAIRILQRHGSGMRRRERAQYAAIAAVNASRTRNWRVAVDYSSASYRCRPWQPSPLRTVDQGHRRGADQLDATLVESAPIGPATKRTERRARREGTPRGPTEE